MHRCASVFANHLAIDVFAAPLLQGRTVDFKNTLLIMTSNVGSSVIEKGGGQLGFQLDVDQVGAGSAI